MTDQIPMRNTLFTLTRLSGKGTASFTVNAGGSVISATGFDVEDAPLELNGFSADASGLIDLSARYALAGNVRVTIGLTPVVTTERGLFTRLFTVDDAVKVPLG